MLARSLVIGFFSAAALYAVPLAAAQTVPTCFGQPATIVGTSGNDTLQGTEEPDVIVGGEGADSIEGRGGDDLICGNEERDTLFGGDGNDKLNGGPDADALVGGSGDDLLLQRGGFQFLGGNLIGGAGDDRLVGSDVQDQLWPGSGRDRVRGRRGKDMVRYDLFAAATRGMTVDLAAGTARGQGLDRLFGVEDVVGSAFADVIDGNDLGNRLAGEQGNDVLRGHGRHDVLTGGSGDDTLYGGTGDDSIGGDEGHDIAHGYFGDDSFGMIDNLRDVVRGGHGRDFAEIDCGLDRTFSIEARSCEET